MTKIDADLKASLIKQQTEAADWLEPLARGGFATPFQEYTYRTLCKELTDKAVENKTEQSTP